MKRNANKPKVSPKYKQESANKSISFGEVITRILLVPPPEKTIKKESKEKPYK